MPGNEVKISVMEAGYEGLQPSGPLFSTLLKVNNKNYWR